MTIIITRVGNENARVDMEIYLAVHDELAERFEAAGLVGEELDVAIVAELPTALAAVFAATMH